MSGNDDQLRLQWAEARLWLAKATEDIEGARILLSGGLSGSAAFHIQQGTEKILKALLLAAAQEINRVHDIGMLSDLARLHWPELIPTPFPLLATNQWYMVTRYPDIEEEPPAASDVEEALLVLESLLASVLGFVSGAAE